jgi:hypothetical protein
MTERPKIGQAGQDLIAKITAGLPDGVELDEREEAILEQAARQADRQATLEDLVAAEGVMTAGSKGQDRLHPALAELRQGALALARLLGQLALPVEVGMNETEASRRARKAANTRHTRTRAKNARGRS